MIESREELGRKLVRSMKHTRLTSLIKKVCSTAISGRGKSAARKENCSRKNPRGIFWRIERKKKNTICV